MKILITETGYICESHEHPIVGRHYIIEDAEEHTASQRKAAHALMQEWYKSGLWDFDTVDWLRFRDLVKKEYGAGFSHYEYVDSNYGMNRVNDLDEIPSDILNDFSAGNKKRIKAILKSFSDYTKKEVKILIDRLIDVMNERGVDTPKYHDILEGLE